MSMTESIIERSILRLHRVEGLKDVPFPKVIYAIAASSVGGIVPTSESASSTYILFCALVVSNAESLQKIDILQEEIAKLIMRISKLEELDER